MTAPIPQHSSASNEHYTPMKIVDAARHVLGGIDLDPATTELVNTRVKADNIYTQETNGFNKDWHGRTFLNPPGGKVGNKSNAALWWSKLVDEYLAVHVTQAIFLGFTLEILATSQDARMWIGEFPFCIPRHRLAFDKEQRMVDFYGGDPEIVSLVKGDSPPHSNVIVYLPKTYCNIDADISNFEQTFGQFGHVTVPEGWRDP